MSSAMNTWGRRGLQTVSGWTFFFTFLKTEIHEDKQFAQNDSYLMKESEPLHQENMKTLLR